MANQKKKSIKNDVISFPRKLLAPIEEFLEKEMVKLNRRRKNIEAGDPFFDPERGGENSLEEEVDEQWGHFEAEIKSSFVGRQLVQIRKALTRIKIGKYGSCEGCGKMIDTDRLAVKPETTLCIKCEKEKNA